MFQAYAINEVVLWNWQKHVSAVLPEEVDNTITQYIPMKGF